MVQVIFYYFTWNLTSVIIIIVKILSKFHKKAAKPRMKKDAGRQAADLFCRLVTSKKTRR